MKSYITNYNETGWQEIPANAESIVAHYKDGTKKVFPLLEFVVLKKKEKKDIIKIDCYYKGEQILL